MKKSVVLYYSLGGSTKKIAELIASETSSDIFAIEPVKEIKSKGFIKYIVAGWSVMTGKKPPIKKISADLSKYDLIFLGGPVWASSYTPPINTFISNIDVSGKDIAYFCCNLGESKEVKDKVRNLIEPNNNLVEYIECINVKLNYNNIKKNVVNWTKKLTK